MSGLLLKMTIFLGRVGRWGQILPPPSSAINKFKILLPDFRFLVLLQSEGKRFHFTVCCFFNLHIETVVVIQTSFSYLLP